jgi:DNA end-binding protein Ku
MCPSSQDPPVRRTKGTSTRTPAASSGTARAMWKGVLKLGGSAVPVKLYAAARDAGVHLRLLHKKDATPLVQQLIHPTTGETVAYESTRRGYVTENREVVLLDEAELEALKPEPSRDIEMTSFLPIGAIDPAWYERPYYLGPDGDEAAYFALAEALERSGREGLARWVMRNTEYVGALRVRDGHLVLITLRWADEMVAASAVEPAEARELAPKDLAMAKKLVAMLEGELDPTQYHEDYRTRLVRLVEDKAKGKVVKLVKAAARPRRDRDLSAALRASLTEVRKVA